MSTNQLRQAASGQSDKPKDIATLMASAKVKQQLALALPKHMTADRMARIATTEMRKVPKLAQCDQASFLGAIMQCAQLGLEPGGALGHAYLIPFENRRQNRTEVQFIVGYRGMIDLARRSGQIVSLAARAVHEKDSFSYEYGLEETLTHKPYEGDGDPGRLTHVYAVAKLKDGGVQFEVMSAADVYKVRDGSQGYKTAVKYNKTDTPWIAHFEEMAKKTAIRRLFKYLPVSIELSTAVTMDERADAGISQENAEALTGEYSVIPDDEPPFDTETGEVLDQQEEQKPDPAPSKKNTRQSRSSEPEDQEEMPNME
jgi:recombination protein RecT